MRALITGCGYIGLALGAELVRQGHEVTGLRRQAEGEEEMKAAGIRPFRADITDPAQLADLRGSFEWVVNTVSSVKGGLEDYRAVYLEGTRNLIDSLGGGPLKKFVYTSSTSVYGQSDGSVVKETSPTEPASETSKVLVETEALLLQAFRERQFPAMILRVAGIYGPDRGHFFHQFIKGEAKIFGKGDRLINMIHRDDLVGGIVAALKHGRLGEIYNAVDDEPVAQVHFFRWLSETLGQPMPPFTSAPETSGRKRGLTNKKVSNRRLRMELGYVFKYPNFRQGYTAEINRLEQGGLLDLNPQPP